MNRQIFILSALLLIVLGSLGAIKLNKDFLLWWNANTIHVSADPPLETDKVKIEFGIGVNSINRSTDKDLFESREKYTVLFDGTAKDKPANNHGENDFLITYGNEYYLAFRHFKFNRRHQHDYNFHFFQEGNHIFVRAEVNGKDAMHIEGPMREIGLADQSLNNVPLKIEE